MPGRCVYCKGKGTEFHRDLGWLCAFCAKRKKFILRKWVSR